MISLNLLTLSGRWIIINDYLQADRVRDSHDFSYLIKYYICRHHRESLVLPKLEMFLTSLRLRLSGRFDQVRLLLGNAKRPQRQAPASPSCATFV